MERSDKKRGANYTQREKELLISLVQKYLNILENKKTNAVYNKQKTECWEKLAREYNSLQTSGLRTGMQLKHCYEQLKKVAKQHKAEDKVETLKTGGGSFIPKLNTMDEKIICLLKNNYFSIENKYDSNTLGPSSESGPSTSKAKNNVSDLTPLPTFNTDETVEDVTYIYEDDSMRNDNYENYKQRGGRVIEEQEVDVLDSLQDITNSLNSPLHTIQDEEPERKKRKRGIEIGTPTITNNKKLNKGNIIIKQNEVLDLKISVLKKIKETEIENLKGKILDNEIKEIIKEKELLDLKIKEIEFNKLIS